MIFKSLFKAKSRTPKNLIEFDYKNINKDEERENVSLNNLKFDLSEKIYRLNQIKLYKLNNAINIIDEYKTLEKEIWGH